MPSPALMVKIAALEERLGADELQLAIHYLGTMTGAEREAWAETLSALPIEEALVRLRRALSMSRERRAPQVPLDVGGADGGRARRARARWDRRTRDADVSSRDA